MSSFLHLDSGFRNVQQFPSPAEYVVTADQVKSWFAQARSVRAYPQEIPKKQYEFVTSLKLLHLVLPYTDELISAPIIYIDLHSQKYQDKNLVTTISSVFPTITFVAEYDKTQPNIAGDPAWIHYKCNMTQVMRWARNNPILFKIVMPATNTVPVITDNTPPELPNPAVQVQATFEMIPYIRDDEYTNHMITTLL